MLLRFQGIEAHLGKMIIISSIETRNSITLDCIDGRHKTKVVSRKRLQCAPFRFKKLLDQKSVDNLHFSSALFATRIAIIIGLIGFLNVNEAINT